MPKGRFKMIEIKEQFEVPANVDFVWKIVSDPYEVVGCLPGAAISSKNEDGSYEGTIGVKFGPTNITFHSVVTLELNAETHEGRLIARAKDKGGRTRTNATVDFAIKPGSNPNISLVDAKGGVEVSGPLASMVENGAVFVVKRMVATFAERLAEKCAPVATPEAVTQPQVQEASSGGFMAAIRRFFCKLCGIFKGGA